MPELPEVQTTADGINKETKGLSIVDVWTDYKSTFHAKKSNIKNPVYFEEFKNAVINRTITSSQRIGKYVLIHLSGDKTILVHMKMTGHFLYGTYLFDGKGWTPAPNQKALQDPFNMFIRLVFTLSNNKHLAFSDMRRFTKVIVFDTTNIHALEDLMHLGPDPLSKDFTYDTFKEQMVKNSKRKIKQVITNQEIISGIGNIYADESLFAASIHPLSITEKIPGSTLKKLFSEMKIVLRKGIDFGGDSMSDYRNIYGEPGKFQTKHKAYRRKGLPCLKKGCSGVISRIVIGGRGTHFCPVHQTLHS